MDIVTKITHVKDLIRRREDIDAELASILGVVTKAKKTMRCSRCGEEGHNSKTCSSPHEAAAAE